MHVHPEDDRPQTCPVCPELADPTTFCGSCGAERRRPANPWRTLLRPRASVVAPRERVGLPMVTSSLFPHLGEASRIPFRHALFGVLTMLVTFSMLRLLGPLVVATCLSVPLLFGIYVWRSDALREISAPALALATVLGAGLGIGWWLWTGDIVAAAYDVPLGAAAQLEYELGLGVLISSVGAVLMLLPVIAVRPMRRRGSESLDGFLIGALGALSYSAAGTVAWLAPQFIAGLLNNFSPWRLLEDALLYGLFDPLTAAGAGGLVGLALWFTPARRGGCEPRRPRAVLWILAAISMALFLGLYLVDAAGWPRFWEIAVSTGLTALSLVTSRAGVQIALLHEAPDPATGRAVRCEYCGRTVPERPFCPDCGAATRALSRSARRLRALSGDSEVRTGWLPPAAVAVVVALIFAVSGADQAPGERGGVIGGPLGRLLAQSTDLGPAQAETVRITAALHQPSRPEKLERWSRGHGLSVRWRDGDGWAVISGTAGAVAGAFGVPVRNYRTRRGPDAGRTFHASPRQPRVPAAARDEVAGVGRVLSYVPVREALPLPLDVPDGGLLPNQLLAAYNATPLTEAGFTGAGTTVVVFAFDGFDQADLDSFADLFDVPPFTPEVVGGMPEQRNGEATMDLQVVHAVAPEAKLVLVNARETTTNEGDGALVKLGRLMDSVNERFPGAIWSLSIGWGCDRLFTAADLTPVRDALRRAVRNGTTAFAATGDLAGLECKGGQNWSDPPSPDDVGVDAVASIPEMTAVGGTRLSTDADGRWLAEQSWYDVPLTHGTAGGASQLYRRPPWQTVGDGAGPPDSRLVPDISAVGDPFTGVKFVSRQQVVVGGGTSQSAPIWAGFAAIINTMFASLGLAPLGEVNPLLYQVAQGATSPSFRDVRLGGNAVSPGGLPGYDMVTGLGSPNVANLAKSILLARSAGR